MSATEQSPLKNIVMLFLLAFSLRLVLFLLVFPDLEGIYDSYQRIIISEYIRQAPLSPEAWRYLWVWLPLPFFLNALASLAIPGMKYAAIGLNLLVSSATCLVLYALAKKFASEKSALVVFGLAALSPFHIVYATTALSETLFTFLVVLSLWFYLKADKTNPKLLLSAWLLGLAALTRYEAWFLIPVLITAAPLQNRADWKILSMATLLLLGAVSLWLYMNYLAYGDPLHFRSALSSYLETVKAYSPEYWKRDARNVVLCVIKYLIPALHVIPLAASGIIIAVKRRQFDRDMLAVLVFPFILYIIVFGSFLSQSSPGSIRFALAPAAVLMITAAFPTERASKLLFLTGTLTLLLFAILISTLVKDFSASWSASQREALNYLLSKRDGFEGMLYCESPLIRVELGINRQRFVDISSTDPAALIEELQQKKVQQIILLRIDHSKHDVFLKMLESPSNREYYIEFDRAETLLISRGNKTADQ